jgi:glycosyltransferase involved in cell wall biosynthesis
MKKILIVADVPNWAFDNIYKALSKFCKNYHFFVQYTQNISSEYLSKNHVDYDLILYLPDYLIDLLVHAKIPKKKVIIAIRSMSKLNFFKDANLMNETASAIVVANSKLFESLKTLHPFVVLAPGGVDTEIFIPKENKLHEPIVVGWAGSRDNFGSDFRGLNLIQEACELLGYNYHPALKEEKWRIIQEMVKYYQDEIDVYVDASKEAGRQNGLLEAAACGKFIIATKDVGISNELIKHEENGLLINRSIESIKQALKDIVSRNEYRNRIDRKSVV